MGWGRKDDKPCDGYWGNVCSGFGGSLTCKRCGWERDEHPSECWWLNEDGTEKDAYVPRHRKE